MQSEMTVLKCILVSFSVCYTMAVLTAMTIAIYSFTKENFNEKVCTTEIEVWAVYFAIDQMLFEQVPLALLFWYHKRCFREQYNA